MSSITLLGRSMLVCSTRPFNVHSTYSKHAVNQFRNFRSQIKPKQRQNFSSQARVVEQTWQEGSKVTARTGL